MQHSQVEFLGAGGYRAEENEWRQGGKWEIRGGEGVRVNSSEGGGLRAIGRGGRGGGGEKL